MKLLKKIMYRLNGLHYPQEYLCLAKESLEKPLHAYLHEGKRIIKDITNQHLFTGYHPLIFALQSMDEVNLEKLNSINIVFSKAGLQPVNNIPSKEIIASLMLKLIRRQPAGNNTFYYYEGIKGNHHFLSIFHQFIIGLNNRLFNRKTDNVFLQGNLYKQVQVAYAIPRVISLITTGMNDLFNVFPTDLHGQIDAEHYIISLRHEGKACQQVEQARRILISQVHPDFYRTAYALGKNHMQDLKEKENFPFSSLVSGIFQLPLPGGTQFYRELELMDSFQHDIHKILLFKIVSGYRLADEPATLAHIHNCYATWRYNAGLPGNYLMR